MEARRDDDQPITSAPGAGPRACRTGESSATRTTSSCSCTAPETDVETLREEIADVLAPLGLRLSPAKTRIVHMSEGFDFLGFRIQWKRKRGTNKWYVYTFIADRPIRSLKAKIRALTNRTSQQDLRAVLIRLNQIMRGWANYFKHAVCKHTFGNLAHFVWWRVIRWLQDAAPLEVEGRPPTASPPPTGGGSPITADGIELFNLETVPVTRYRYRGNTIPNPWALQPRLTAGTVESPVRREWRTPGSASGLGKRTGSNPGTAPQADSTGCSHLLCVSFPVCLGAVPEDVRVRAPSGRGPG